jgi:hypothetical protein
MYSEKKAESFAFLTGSFLKVSACIPILRAAGMNNAVSHLVKWTRWPSPGFAVRKKPFCFKKSAVESSLEECREEPEASKDQTRTSYS